MGENEKDGGSRENVLIKTNFRGALKTFERLTGKASATGRKPAWG